MDAAKQRVCLLAAVVALVLLQPGTGRGELCTAGPSSDLACAGGGGGSGDVTGPASSTDNAAVRWDQSTGTVIQNSNVLITDGGQIQTPNQNDQSPPEANLVEIPGNAVDLTTNPTCANKVAAGSWGLIDTDESAAMALKMCLSNSDLDGFRPPNVGDARIERAQTLHGTGSGSGVWTLDRHDVRDYGALGDGSTDDTTAIRAAIWAACQATGPATVYFPGTANYYKITERLPVYSESTAHIPWNTPASAMVSGCESAGVPLPCCAARNVGYCGVEPYKCDGITFEGDGPKKSRIVQMYTENTTNGDTLSTRPVFDIRAADWITIRDLSLENGTTKATPYPTGTSKSTIASYLLAREWRAGISSIDGVDHLLVDNVHFSNFTADIRLRGHSDNTTKTYDTVVHNSTSSKTTYGILGGDNHVGTRIEGWKVSYEQSETNAPHGVYLAAAHSTARLYDTQITDVQCGDWDGAGLGCDPDGGCLSLRDTTGLTVTNAESVGCGIGDLAGVIGATVTNTRSLAKSTALGNVGGCWGIQNGSTDVDLGDFYCNAGDIIAPGSCGAGTGNPVGCCTGSGTGPTCNNSPVMDLNSATPATDHVKRIHIHDGEIHAYNPVAVAYGAIHVTSGIGTADYIDIHDVDVFNDYTATGIAWPALRVEQRGFFNSARNIRQFPKNNSSRPVRFNFSGGGEWFLDLPDPPGFDDSTLPDVNTAQKHSRVLCHNCSETVTTGVCSTGWTNSNRMATSDGQNWICGTGSTAVPTPTPTATATPTVTPTPTATTATATPTPTVTPTLSTPLPTP